VRAARLGGAVLVGALLAACTASAPGGSDGAPTVRANGSPTRSRSASPSATPRVGHPPRHHHRPAISGVAPHDLPDHDLTPGVALDVTAADVCVPGYASSARDVPVARKIAVDLRYGVVDVPYRHEVDHLISLELGGSNGIRNLWPEPYAGRWGARTKDRLEDRLHELVCDGRIALDRAQHLEATDWIAAYRRFVGSPATFTDGPRPTSPGGFDASTHPTADTVDCADDPEWRNLSATYRVHLRTWAQVRRRFPTYHLHEPC
jgi:hypothetical protein